MSRSKLKFALLTMLAVLIATAGLQAQTVNKTATVGYSPSTSGACASGCTTNVYAVLTNNVSACPASPTYSRVNTSPLPSSQSSFSWPVAVSAPFCLQAVATSVDGNGYESAYSNAAVFLQQAPQAPTGVTATVK